MGSLRNRLLVGSIGVMSLTLAVAGGVIYSRVSSALYREFDEAIHEKALVFASLTEFTDDGLEVDFSDEDFHEFRDVENPSYFQVWQADGTVLRRSESLAGDDLTIAPAQRDPHFVPINLPDGRKGRQVAITFFPKIDEDLLDGRVEDEVVSPAIRSQVANSSNGRIDQSVTIVVAASTAEIDSMIARLFWLIFAVAVASATASFLLIFIVVWSGLLPLKRIADNIETIDEQSLDAGIEPGSVPAEIVPIVNRLNGLLQRVDAVMRRERAFSSEVSHELRTPLAGISSTIEVCLTRPRDSVEYTEALRVCHKICRQSQQMVESLLAIARIEAGQVQHDVQNVALTDLIHECVYAFEDHARSKGVTVESYPLESVSIETDEDKLRVIMRNLMQNAVSHCDDRGKVRISTECTNGCVAIAFENTGNQVTPDEIPALCDRFWRGDVARSRTGDHFGLGLALVKKLVDFMGGKLKLTVSGPVFRATVLFPLRYNTDAVIPAPNPNHLHQANA